MPDAPKQDQPQWGKFASVGLEVAAGVGLGALIGAWVDKHRGTNPWGVLIGCGIGFVAGMYLFLKDAIKANRN